MARQENAATDSDFTSEPVPTSDNDPYSPSSTPPGQVMIQMDELPKPPPILGPLQGFTLNYQAHMINERIQRSSQLLHRPVTQDEAAAMAFWTSKGLSITAWGSPLGAVAGAFRAYQTRDTYRFPFMKPDMAQFNPDYFWGLKGSKARIGWQSLRFAAYTCFSSFVGRLLLTFYAATVAAVGEQRDPRMKEVVKAVEARVRGTRGPAGVPTGNTGPMGDPRGEAMQRGPRGVLAEDDASPSSGNSYEPYGYGSAARGESIRGVSDGGVLDDRQMRSQEVRQRPNPRTSPTADTAGTFRIDKVERQPSSFDDYDDASPTGGAGASMDDDPSTGSAWDRIRQQAASSSPGSSGRWQAGAGADAEGSSTIGDSFTFSSTEEERQLAKEEAQREFDERVERERRGGNF